MGFADANAYLATRGVSASKFENIGESHTGRIIDVDVQPSTDPNGEVKRSQKTGEVINQLVITWVTEERNPQVARDDGTRKLYTSWRLEAAIKTAIKKAGGDGFEPNGVLTVTFVAEEKIQGMGSKAKVYEASYKRPNLADLTVNESTGEVDEEKADPDKLALAKTLKSAGQPIESVASITGLSQAVLEREVFGF